MTINIAPGENFLDMQMARVALDISNIAVLVTGRAEGYEWRNYAYPPFLATISFTVTADKAYQNMAVRLDGAPLVLPEMEGGVYLGDIPQGESTYSFETWWPVYSDPAYAPAFVVYNFPYGIGPWGTVRAGIGQLGIAPEILLQRLYDLRASLLSQMEAMLGQTILVKG